MNKDFDLFERLPDGSPMWRGHVSDTADLDTKLGEIARRTKNECFALHLPTKQIVRRMNANGLPNLTSDSGASRNHLKA
jgi:pyrrolidone-carboxylate peptidase